MGKQGICSNKQMAARNQDSGHLLGKASKELLHLLLVLLGQHGEARQRAPLGAVIRRGNAPDPTTTRAQLLLLGICIFAMTVRWIRNDGLNGCVWLSRHPV